MWQAVILISEFCALQQRLVRDFMAAVRPADTEFFRGIGRGTITSEGESWTYRHHGAGISFSNESCIIDAHAGMANHPGAVDAWRLLQFLESRSIGSIQHRDRTFDASEEVELDQLLALLEAEGLLRRVPPTGGRRFVLSASGREPS